MTRPPKEGPSTLAGEARGESKHRQGAQPLLVQPRAAAAMLSISERRLWTLERCGAIPSRRIGRSVRYCPDELAAWVAAGCPTAPGSAVAIRKGARG